MCISAANNIFQLLFNTNASDLFFGIFIINSADDILNLKLYLLYEYACFFLSQVIVTINNNLFLTRADNTQLMLPLSVPGVAKFSSALPSSFSAVTPDFVAVIRSKVCNSFMIAFRVKTSLIGES
jgi:hypothetical protein